VKQHLKHRLPIALLVALIMGVGYQIIDLGSVWQLALVGALAMTALTSPTIAGWLRARRSLREDNRPPQAPV
jgi:hypothetical protein